MQLLLALVIIAGGARAPVSSQSSFRCESAGYHGDPDNCSVFYRCVSFWGGQHLRPVMFRCKEPTVFDQAFTVCQFPWKMRPRCVKNSDGIWVREGQAATVLPPADVLPNITILELGSPDAVTSPPPSYQVASGSPYECPGPGEYFASVEDMCVFYYQCAEIEPGVLNATLYRCREGEIFTQTTRQCLRPSPLPACGQTAGTGGSGAAAEGVAAGVAVEEETYDDRDFYLEPEFNK